MAVDASVRLGRRVRDLRDRKSWSQHDLAAAIRTGHIYISQLENGHSNPTLNVLDALARAFGMTLSELLQGV